jgi:glycosyltransferase involved in cell wall biosynthesis
LKKILNLAKELLYAFVFLIQLKLTRSYRTVTSNSKCIHIFFISPWGYKYENLLDYAKDREKYLVYGQDVESTFVVYKDGDEPLRHEKYVVGLPICSPMKIRMLYDMISKESNPMLAINGDMFSSLVALFFKFFFKVPYLYYCISSPTSNFYMTPGAKRTLKDRVGILVHEFSWRNAKYIFGSRIMHYEIMYKLGERGLTKFISTDHIMRGTIELSRSPDSAASLTSRVIVLVTRFEKMKRSEDGIEAFLNSKARSCGYRLVVVGDGNGELAARARYQAYKEIEFRGRIPNATVVNLIESSRFVICPHSGGVSIEAGMAARPTICYGTNAMPEFLIDNYTGLLVDCFDAEDFARKVNLLLDDDNLVTKLGANAFAFIRAKFSSSADIRSRNRLLATLRRNS